jgi:hypothetical protein
VCCFLAYVFLLFGLVLFLVVCEFCFWLAVRTVVGWPCLLMLVGCVYCCSLDVCIVVC